MICDIQSYEILSSFYLHHHPHLMWHIIFHISDQLLMIRIFFLSLSLFIYSFIPLGWFCLSLSHLLAILLSSISIIIVDDKLWLNLSSLSLSFSCLLLTKHPEETKWWIETIRVIQYFPFSFGHHWSFNKVSGSNLSVNGQLPNYN